MMVFIAVIMGLGLLFYIFLGLQVFLKGGYIGDYIQEYCRGILGVLTKAHMRI